MSKEDLTYDEQFLSQDLDSKYVTFDDSVSNAGDDEYRDKTPKKETKVDRRHKKPNIKRACKKWKEACDDRKKLMEERKEIYAQFKRRLDKFDEIKQYYEPIIFKFMEENNLDNISFEGGGGIALRTQQRTKPLKMDNIKNALAEKVGNEKELNTLVDAIVDSRETIEVKCLQKKAEPKPKKEPKKK